MKPVISILTNPWLITLFWLIPSDTPMPFMRYTSKLINFKIQGVSKKVPTFVFLISRLPKHLETCVFEERGISKTYFCNTWMPKEIQSKLNFSERAEHGNITSFAGLWSTENVEHSWQEINCIGKWTIRHNSLPHL